MIFILLFNRLWKKSLSEFIAKMANPLTDSRMIDYSAENYAAMWRFSRKIQEQFRLANDRSWPKAPLPPRRPSCQLSSIAEVGSNRLEKLAYWTPHANDVEFVRIFSNRMGLTYLPKRQGILQLPRRVFLLPYLLEEHSSPSPDHFCNLRNQRASSHSYP